MSAESDNNPERLHQDAEVVATGYPLVSLLACKRCGVLLWDVAAHYRHAHREVAD